MQVGIRLGHHDHEYVERRGGWEFYSHVRGGTRRAEARRRAITRATALYNDAWARGADDTRLGGLGLLVLQRTALAVEDLGGLSFALAGDGDHWARLTSTKIPDLDLAFASMREAIESDAPAREQLALAPFRIGTDDQLRGEPGWSPTQIEAAFALSDLYAERWRKQMRPVVNFWQNYRRAAKGTLHGNPVIAGAHIIGPPPAGELAEHVVDPGVPFAVLLETTVKDGSTYTALEVVRCDPPAVVRFAFAGRAAADLYHDLASQQAATIARGIGAQVPDDLLHRLPARLRAALEETPRVPPE